MSTVSETRANNGESASAPRRRTGHEEITDLAYEAADHAQDFAEEIEDAVSASSSGFLQLAHKLWCHWSLPSCQRDKRPGSSEFAC